MSAPSFLHITAVMKYSNSDCEKMRALLKTSIISVFPLHTPGLGGSTGDALANYAASFCPRSSIPSDLTSLQSQGLEGLVGSRNNIKEAMYDTACGELWSCLQQRQGEIISRVVLVGVPVIASGITLLLWILMGSCACCRCCRRCPVFCCCQRRGPPSKLNRGVVGILALSIILFIVGVSLNLKYATKAVGSFNDGNSAMLCETFRISSESINGVSIKNNGTRYLFSGSQRLAASMSSLASAMNPSSPEVVLIADTVRSTVEIDNALRQLYAYLDLVREIMAKPFSGFEQELPSLNDLQARIEETRALQLDEIRSSVDATLRDERLHKAYESLAEAETWISSLSSTIEKSLDETLVRNAGKIAFGVKAIYIATLATLVSVLIPVIFVILIFFSGARRLKGQPATGRGSASVALCGWCWAISYAFITLLLGGAFLIAGYFQASLCDMAHDTDSLIDRITVRATSGNETLAAATQIIDSCIKTTRDGNFLDATYLGNETARSLLEKAYLLENEFNDLFSSAAQSIESISQNEEFRRVIEKMKTFEGVSLMGDVACNKISSLTDKVTNVTFYFAVPKKCTSKTALKRYVNIYLASGFENSAIALDRATHATYAAFKERIDDYVKTRIFAPLGVILNGTDCRFLGDAVQRVYSGFCFLQTPATIELGFTFTAFGALTWIAVIVMYIIWKRLNDIQSPDKKTKTDMDSPPQGQRMVIPLIHRDHLHTE